MYYSFFLIVDILVDSHFFSAEANASQISAVHDVTFCRPFLMVSFSSDGVSRQLQLVYTNESENASLLK